MSERYVALGKCLRLICICLLALISSCAGGTHTTASSGNGGNRNATIEVRDDSNQVVVGALVVDLNGGAMAETDANGEAQIRVALDESKFVSLQITNAGVSSDVRFSAADSKETFDATVRIDNQGQAALESIETDKKKKKNKKKTASEQVSETSSDEEAQTDDTSNEDQSPDEEKKEKPSKPKATPTTTPSALPTPSPQPIEYSLNTNSDLYEPGDTFSISLTLSGDIDEAGNSLASYEGKTVVFLIGEDVGASTTLSFSNGYHTFPAKADDPFFEVSFMNYTAPIVNGRATFSLDLPAWLPPGIYRLNAQGLVTPSTKTFLYGASNIKGFRLVAP